VEVVETVEMFELNETVEMDDVVLRWLRWGWVS
jgi:hypothetical protein